MMHVQPFGHTVRRLSVLLLAGLLGACGSDDPSGEFYTTWDENGACQSGATPPWGISAAGTALGPCTGAEDQFLWVTYAALWCAASQRQVPLAAQMFRELPADTRYALVLTGSAEVSVPATADEARRWASQYRLDPARVVSEVERSYRTIPQHLLLGPDGRTWWRYVGFIDAATMRGILEDFRAGRRAPRSF